MGAGRGREDESGGDRDSRGIRARTRARRRRRVHVERPRDLEVRVMRPPRGARHRDVPRALARLRAPHRGGEWRAACFVGHIEEIVFDATAHGGVARVVRYSTRMGKRCSAGPAPVQPGRRHGGVPTSRPRQCRSRRRRAPRAFLPTPARARQTRWAPRKESPRRRRRRRRPRRRPRRPGRRRRSRARAAAPPPPRARRARTRWRTPPAPSPRSTAACTASSTSTTSPSTRGTTCPSPASPGDGAGAALARSPPRRQPSDHPESPARRPRRRPRGRTPRRRCSTTRSCARARPSDCSPEDDMHSVVSVHNAMNEDTWRRVVAWEKRLHVARVPRPDVAPVSGEARRPLRPLACVREVRDRGRECRSTGTTGTSTAAVKQVRYVIDYYFHEDKAGTPGQFDLVVRPAADSVRRAVADRVKMSDVRRVRDRSACRVPISGNNGVIGRGGVPRPTPPRRSGSARGGRGRAATATSGADTDLKSEGHSIQK